MMEADSTGVLGNGHPSDHPVAEMSIESALALGSGFWALALALGSGLPHRRYP